MNFQTLLKIETSDIYLDRAAKYARETSQQTKQSFKGKKISKLQKSRIMELEKMKLFTKTLTKQLTTITTSFPSIDQLPEFYVALIKTTLDYDLIKKSLGAIKWATEQLPKIEAFYRRKILASTNIDLVNQQRKIAYGRMSSITKQISKNLQILEESRRTMKTYPSIKTSIPTIVIAGYPNTGKTTLLKALTGSTPRIAPYPFTTQKLMIGYTELENQTVQFIDTPGLLDRPWTKRNTIEKQAILALKHLAQTIIFVIDPTQSCGYSLEEQHNLLNQIQQEFKQKTIITLNKTDIATTDVLTTAKEYFPTAITISADKDIGINNLVSELKKILYTPPQQQNT